MSRPLAGQCVHCFTQSNSLTWDHVFPKGWYPPTTPPNLEKWKVPACLKCNREYGVLEEDLFTVIALCLDPDDIDTKALVDKALRSIDPSAGRDGKDKKKRAQRRHRVYSQFVLPDQVPEHAVYPNFGRRDDGEVGGIRIRARYLHKLCEKMVRGITYIEDKQLIRDPYRVHFFALDDEGARPIVSMLQTYGKQYAREPGVEIYRAVAREDGISSAYAITIWRRLKMYAVVDARD